MFLYHSCDRWHRPTVEKSGLLCQSLHDAQLLNMEKTVVIDQRALENLNSVGTGYRAESIPPDAILNLNPYAQPREVTAAGGIVRHLITGELLCIKRHGVTDLPKGKLDGDEAIASCAIRELQEETGVKDLTQGRLLGTTLHGYRRSEYFDIKTTYWYAFTSVASEFTPAHNEGIESVFWISYAQAEQTLGYALLRDFLKDLRLAYGEDIQRPRFNTHQ